MSKGCYHFVFVHGVCHGAWCWYKVVTLLRSSGHMVTALDMASCGRDTKQVDDVPTLADYYKPLRLFFQVLPEDEKVILVGHSRGGIDISMAMERFPDKIAVAVFVTASMPGPNLDVSTISKEFERTQDSPMDNEFTYGNGKEKPPTSVLIGPEFMAAKMYDLSPPEDLTLATFLIRPSPLYEDFNTPSKETVLTEQNYGRVRRVYVVTKQDKTMKEEIQRWLIESNPPDEVKVINDSGHMVMMSKPQELCTCLVESATKYCS